MIKKYTHYSVEIEDNLITVMYPDGDVFLRERNNITLTALYEDVALVSIKIGGKIINFGKHYFGNEPVVIDVSAYYSKDNVNSIDITIIDGVGLTEEFTIPLSLTKHDCYSPFLEFVPERCGDAPYARIVPPNRMLWDGKKKTTSMLAAVRDDDYFSGYEYEMDGIPGANYRPSNNWITTTQKQEHLGETYRDTLPETGNLADLDSNGNLLWIVNGYISPGASKYGKSFGEIVYASDNICISKTIFASYNGLTISNIPQGVKMLMLYFNANKKYALFGGFVENEKIISNADSYPYFALYFSKTDESALTPSELVGITSSALTNPEAGKSYRWVEQNGVFSWLELTKEQIINNSFAWYFGGKRYFDDVINKTATFEKSFEALYQRVYALSPTNKQYTTIQSVSRSVSLADSSLPYVYIRWRMPWGVTVEHLFYLGSYSSDKEGAKELESANYYEELSNHVRVGSFYLDGITQPYDLFYYKTLENTELVEMYFPSYAFKKATYMPTGDTYVAINVKSSDVSDAVVDGVTKRTITFKFELS